MIYDVVFGAMVLSWCVCHHSAPWNRRALIGWCLFLISFIGFRFRVGCDWLGYLNIFDLTVGATFNEASELTEPAYAAMFTAIHAANLDYPVINVLSAVIFVAGAYGFCRRRPDPLAALVTLFPIAIIHLAMSAIRQASGLAILMLAFNAYMDRKRLRYAAFVLLASLFHHSAIVFLPYTLCIGRRFSPLTTTFIALVVAAGVSLVGSLGFEDYQSRYIDAEVVANGAPVRVGVIAIAAIAFFWNARAWRIEHPEEYGWLSLMSGAMIACFPLSILYPVVGDRFGYYLIPAQVTIFNRLPYLKDRRSPNLLLAIAPFVLLGGFQVLWLLTSQLAELCYWPYRWWLFDWLT